jgi:hypothetical protein
VKNKPKIEVRAAVLEDMAGVYEMDATLYGNILEEQTQDSPINMFKTRFHNCHGYFWVALVDGKIEGFLSAQPMKNKTTTDGTFEGTFDPASDSVYIAALSVTKKGSDLDCTDRLLAIGMKKAVLDNRHYAYFIARMPGYHKVKDKMTPEEYYEAKIEKNGKQVPLDWQLRMYESLGTKRIRLVLNGYEPDWESGGHGVLCVMEMPFYGKPYKKLGAYALGFLGQHPGLAKLIGL